ncbi:zinc finger protein ZAT9 [Tanacetum coccineum]
MGDSREFGSGQSSRDLGKNKLRNTFKYAVYFKEFGSRSALVGHIRALYRKCLVCSKVFEPGEDLEDHKRANSCVKKGSTVYKCSICYREFGSGKAVGGHKRVHNNVIKSILLQLIMRIGTVTRKLTVSSGITSYAVNVARCAFCDNDTYSNKAFEAVEFLDITFVIAANMLDPISKTIKLELENERTSVAELDSEIFK